MLRHELELLVRSEERLGVQGLRERKGRLTGRGNPRKEDDPLENAGIVRDDRRVLPESAA
jgi:hypothetical protein